MLNLDDSYMQVPAYYPMNRSSMCYYYFSKIALKLSQLSCNYFMLIQYARKRIFPFTTLDVLLTSNSVKHLELQHGKGKLKLLPTKTIVMDMISDRRLILA